MSILFRNSNLDRLVNPRLGISITNNLNAPVEADQEIDAPAIVTKQSIWWGYTWYMQTPLENIGDDFSISIRLLHGPPGSPPGASGVVPLSKYHIDKEDIDSGSIRFNFSSNPHGANSSKYAGGRSTTTAPKTEDTSVFKRMTFATKRASSTEQVDVVCDMCLEGDLQITKFYRDIDLEKTVKREEEKKFTFIPTSGGSNTNLKPAGTSTAPSVTPSATSAVPPAKPPSFKRPTATTAPTQVLAALDETKASPRVTEGLPPRPPVSNTSTNVPPVSDVNPVENTPITQPVTVTPTEPVLTTPQIEAVAPPSKPQKPVRPGSTSS
jgi:hypothetical protein